MKLREILSGIRPVKTGVSLETEITGVAYDSRNVQPGYLFVAVQGFTVDGHDYISRALEQGAAAVLCQKETEGPCVVVENSREALALASANFFGRPAEKMTFIGITGTNGKTTSTYLLKDILEERLGAKVGLVGTIQNMIGDRVIETERTTCRNSSRRWQTPAAPMWSWRSPPTPWRWIGWPASALRWACSPI